MSIPYDLENPDKIYKLPEILLEISGIHSVGDELLACVGDEYRNIYLFNLSIGEIYDYFGKFDEGDSEDVVIIDKTAYILVAKDCAIYEYKNFRESMKQADKYPLKIDEKYDPEGLCHDPESNCLLVACKGNPKKKVYTRQILLISLNDNELDSQLYFTIDGNELGERETDKAFNPSGIAIHPKTKEIYMVGTKGLKMLIRLDKEGKKILGKKMLDDKIYNQPEGIAFSEDGELFISSEGKKEKKKIIENAMVFRFRAKELQQ